jgi:adenine-specific DNA-methyltransferase
MEAHMTDDHDDLDPHRLDLRSADLVAPRIKALASLFPEAIRDGKIDVDVIAQALGDVSDDGPERFGLTWPGKAEAIRVAQRPSEGTLVPMKDQSVNWDDTQNLVIEGENLEVLKLLQRSYHGKVKLIYIDPPYNTGKDFVYPDNFRDPLGEYLRLSGQVGEDGGRLRANTETSGRFHSSWLSMMWPRLHLARSLLAADGVIAVSISDVEAPNLRAILSEVFGEENFVCQFVWNNDGNVDNQSAIKSVHEYIVCYARDLQSLPRPTVIDPNIEESSKLYNDQIENSITKNGPKNPPSVVSLPAGFPCTFESGTLPPTVEEWPHRLDPVVVANGQLATAARLKSGWSSRKLLDLFIANGFEPIVDKEGQQTRFCLTESGAVYQYKIRGDSQGHVLSVLRNMGTTKKTSNELARAGIVFSYPKPVFLVQYLVAAFTPGDAPSMVLDFFAGSGTTGEAVRRQNGKDGAGRRYLLVQFPEPAGSEDEVTQTVADITRARLALPSHHGGADATGFRSFRLAASSRLAAEEAGDGRQVVLAPYLAIDPARDDEALLTEVLLARGFDLVTPTEWRELGGLNVALVADGALVACFARHLTVEQFEALVALDPAQLVVLEAAFGGNDEVKVNSLQHLKTVNAHRDTPIELLVL